MQLLSTSPEVAFDRIHPYEHRYLSYLLEWAAVIDRTHFDRELWAGNPTHRLPVAHGLVGPMPWTDRGLANPPDAAPFSVESFKLIWRAFSQRAANRTRAQHPGSDRPVRYYAEKFYGAHRLLALEHLRPIRVVALVRDPRSTWLSFLAFHRKRPEGFLRLHQDETVDDRRDHFIRRQAERLRWLDEIRRDGEHLVIRYEDLITDLSGQLERLTELLAIEFDVEALSDPSPEHVTSTSPEASVGRWRREMDSATVALFNGELGELLEAFKYATD